MTAVGQSADAPQASAPTEHSPQSFKSEELEQIVAPIALYPDPLLAQIFMASTYPLEVVQAARWSKDHPGINGDSVAQEMRQQSWDASVKSLVAFPDVLAMMNEKLDWMLKLGDAFLVQKKDVMDAVQRLRKKATDAGNLESSKEQVVRTETTPEGAAAPPVIVIESSSPDVVYVPTYNPSVVYGAWPYPAYPPYYYYPPAYVPGATFLSFGAGVIVGGALWGNCNWGYGDVDIDVNRYNNFNRTDINRNTSIDNRSGNRTAWQHDAAHRQGVGYRDPTTQQRYGRGSSEDAVQSREEFRGRADQSREQIAREGAGGQGAGGQRDLGADPAANRDGGANGGNQYRDLGGGNVGNGDLGGGQARDSATSQHRDLGGTANRESMASQRSSSSDTASRSRSPDAFRDVSNGASARSNSMRGGASRGGGGRRR